MKTKPKAGGSLFKFFFDTCYDRGAHHIFSEVSQFGSLRPLPKTDLGEKSKLLA